MAIDRDDDALRGVSLRIGGRTVNLRATAVDGRKLPSLAAEAVRWTYVLRARERWADSSEARNKREQDAIRTLASFGLGPAQLEEIGTAELVIVHTRYDDEAEGWAARIFPWEYVLSAATRRLRENSAQPFVIERELFPKGRPATPMRGAQKVFLYVQSAPGRLAEAWDFDDELGRLRRALGTDVTISVLKNPTLEGLAAEVQRLKPALIHLTGFDNVQGLRELRELSGPQTLVDIVPKELGLAGEEEVVHGYAPVRLATLLRDERALQDGYFMTSPGGRPCVVTARALATALGAPAVPAAVIAVSVANSAPRTAALLVGEGAALSAIGFQGDIDDALAEYFFELLYGQLMYLGGAIGPAFERSWARARLEPRARRATGITLWSALPLAARAGEKPPTAARRNTGDPALQVQPADELNYAVLHNTDQGLFRKFIIERNGAQAGQRIAVEVELQLGMETARYSNTFLVEDKDDRWNLTNEIHVPLTAGLVRSVRETVTSTLTVQLCLEGKVLTRRSHRIRLLPVDQWRDNAKDGQWLPSFVLPRDAAVMLAVQQAQRYVRVLRDDPTAGFEGYQVAAETDPTEQELMEVDLQVQAIWATLVHEWQLGYINPPPTYSAQLDSQRLRTPSTVRRNAAGTCIDLALLLAACLELVDIYPVVFLLEGHALPGYWRHHSYHEQFRQAVFKEHETGAPADASIASSADIQKYPWQTLGRDAHRELAARIRARELVPIETVRLTENTGFVEAIEAGTEALAHARDFHSLLDIVHARQSGVTPLPIVEEA